jgi:phage terminase large subunit-like protein
MPEKTAAAAALSVEAALAQIPPELAARLERTWRLHARPEQLPPPEPWASWVLLGGRGAGKTRAGAEWVRMRVEEQGARRIALIGATLRDVREVMLEGPSGLLAVSRAQFQPSRGRLAWPNGAVAFTFTAERPQRLRGPQFDTAWIDEFAAWRDPEALQLLRLGLRLGSGPKLLVTTTPRASAPVKALLGEPDLLVTTAPMRANRMHLAPGFLGAAEARWAGSAYGRQELDGVLVEDLPGALWRRDELEACRITVLPTLQQVVVAVDPPAKIGRDGCGLVAAGVFRDGPLLRAVVLADDSARGLRPEQWAARAVALARRWGAAGVVAEANQGGEMVRSVLRAAGAATPVRLRHASSGKRARAEPVRAWYAAGRVLHWGRLPELEDEMCAFGAPEFHGSPDRLDALVWALSELLGAPEPRVRPL